ncbi:PREDICTED: folliculin-interacting protein 2 [Dufourea novaeangliae]|uniref:Folliculin-interacting protein 2 n=1 Tax=Dufourea novaeangliae TaxID=178035 RepID=A0A154P1C7_DUFNO|nr:PREDICTED: folliculin-interacting protein 2 [Dufourea novaeangliae]KZC05661.1 Folliculin-interacting protein 2 [Dufourea novaeangliae]
MMPLLDKLFPSRRSFRNNVQTFVASNVGAQEDDRDSALCLGSGQVRILLFRECEWRGRKLLFDSLSLEKRWHKNKTTAIDLKNNARSPNADSINFASGRGFERERTAEDDVSLLSEMVFGTVAMTYRGPSFKIHSMNSPSCIMCTKVFPATEHNNCKPSERVSDEGLGRSVNLDSNSSIRTLLSQPSSGNLSGSELNAGPRKNSICSSNSSGWDIDIPPPMGSSQSLESSGSSGIGSLSSLRRRWLRVVSTSLTRSDSDDVFGMQLSENGGDNRDNHGRRHKTRLGLTMLVRLAKGHERRIEACLLEHMALLEGMLDRLRYFCIESGNLNAQNKGVQLPERLYRSSSKFVVSLLRLLTNVNTSLNTRAPLLWHDVLLNSVKIEHKISTLHCSLQQMCQLLEEVDTKSTNFFLSTVVTAVLTYHLGWINTTLPVHDRQLMEKVGTWYPCNPLWAQLGDLYGALGNPSRVAHTVVAGDPQKVELINSVLSFLSYFIRSGIVRKCQEYCCVTEEDIQEAANVIEQARLKRPHLFNPKLTSTDRGSLAFRRVSQASPRKQIPVQEHLSDTECGDAATQRSYPRCTMDRLRAEGSVSPLKRTTTMETNLDSFMLKPFEVESERKLFSKELPLDENQKTTVDEKTCASSKVKIIVSDSATQDITDGTKTDTEHCPDFPLRNFEKKLEDDDTEELFANSKTDTFQEYETSVDPLKLYSSRPDFESGQSMVEGMKNSHVYFMLGDEGKSSKTLPRPRLGYNCQCSYMFTRVPSTSAQLPEGVLRKIIQRNFPESSKSIQSPPGAPSSMTARFCQRCNGQGYAPSQNFDSSKQVLETPTNATEVLRTCGNTVGDENVGLSRSNSLEALMEASSVVELPMPRSKKIKKTDLRQDTGFTKTLLQNRIKSDESRGTSNSEPGYTWGLVLQGLQKKKRRRKRNVVKQGENNCEVETDREWWYCIREECLAGIRFPTIDQPIAESLCILADLDTWHVGIISNNTPSHTAPLPVGMSRLVANMLEGFAYLWRKYHSASHCVGILEAKLREMWLKSEALAEMLMATELCDASVANLTNALDLDAADIPLLLAVATSHSPEIAQRFGLTLA